jgi:hypothetical protein
MMAEISKHVAEYELRLRGMQQVQWFSRGRRMLGPDSGPPGRFYPVYFQVAFRFWLFLKQKTGLFGINCRESWGSNLLN